MVECTMFGVKLYIFTKKVQDLSHSDTTIFYLVFQDAYKFGIGYIDSSLKHFFIFHYFFSTEK